MRNSEYNNFDEIKTTKEHQVFEPIKTSLYNKETYKSSTESLDTKEFNDIKKQDKTIGTKENKSIVKKLLQKVSEATSAFTGSIAVTAVVAVTSVVIFTSILFKTPNIVLLDLTSGYDYVSYEIYIDEMDENVVYYSVVSNLQEIDLYLLTEGENGNIIENLTPNTKYDLTVIGIPRDESNEIEYFKISFYTKGEANKTKVKWIVEGVVIKEIEINQADTPIYDGETPTKEMTIDEEYIFTGWNEEINDENEIIYTAMFDVIKHEFTATYNQVSKTDVIINYDQKDYYNLSFNTDFDNTNDSRLAYRIILTDLLTNEIYQYEGTNKLASINVPISVTTLSITYESIGIYEDKVKVYNTTLLDDNLEISVIDVNIDDNLNLVETDMYQLAMQIDTNFENEEIYNAVKLIVTFDDDSVKEIKTENVIVNDIMTIDILVPAYCASFNVAYTIDLLGANGHNQRFITGTKEFTLESSFELLNVYVDANDFMNTRFLFKYHLTNQNTTLAVKDTATNNVTTMYETESYIDVALDNSLEQNSYNYYLSSLDGSPLSTETNVVVNTQPVSGVHTFSYVNPSDAIVTFNDDNTMNIYLDTFFETEDPDIWYLVRYTNFTTDKFYDVKYTQSIASFENISFDNYGLTYFVYKTIDGIHYQINYVSVSGGIEITHDAISYGELREDELGNLSVYVSFSEYRNVNVDSFKLFIDGEEHILSFADFVLTDGVYELNYAIDSLPNQILLEYEGSYNDKSIYEQISSSKELKGQQYRKMYYEII